MKTTSVLVLCFAALAAATCVSEYARPPPTHVATKVMQRCMARVDELTTDHQMPMQEATQCAKACRNFMIASELPLCPAGQHLRVCRSTCESFKSSCHLPENFDCSVYAEENCNQGPMHELPHKSPEPTQPTQPTHMEKRSLESLPQGYDRVPWNQPIEGKTTHGSWCVRDNGVTNCKPADYEHIFMCYNWVYPRPAGVNCHEFDWTTDSCASGSFIDTHSRNRTACQQFRWEGMQMASHNNIAGWQCNSEGGDVIPCRSFSDSDDQCRLVQLQGSQWQSLGSSDFFGPKAESACNWLYGQWRMKNGEETTADDLAFNLF